MGPVTWWSSWTNKIPRCRRRRRCCSSQSTPCPIVANTQHSAPPDSRCGCAVRNVRTSVGVAHQVKPKRAQQPLPCTHPSSDRCDLRSAAASGTVRGIDRTQPIECRPRTHFLWPLGFGIDRRLCTEMCSLDGVFSDLGLRSCPTWSAIIIIISLCVSGTHRLCCCCGHHKLSRSNLPHLPYLTQKALVILLSTSPYSHSAFHFH
jgi:hypothetical protein